MKNLIIILSGQSTQNIVIASLIVITVAIIVAYLFFRKKKPSVGVIIPFRSFDEAEKERSEKISKIQSELARNQDKLVMVINKSNLDGKTKSEAVHRSWGWKNTYQKLLSTFFEKPPLGSRKLFLDIEEGDYLKYKFKIIDKKPGIEFPGKEDDYQMFADDCFTDLFTFYRKTDENLYLSKMSAKILFLNNLSEKDAPSYYIHKKKVFSSPEDRNLSVVYFDIYKKTDHHGNVISPSGPEIKKPQPMPMN